jgi:hypothetical protein
LKACTPPNKGKLSSEQQQLIGIIMNFVKEGRILDALAMRK